MKLTKLSQLYALAILILALGSGYFFWQQNSLMHHLDENRKLCEEKLAELLLAQQAQQNRFANTHNAKQKNALNQVNNHQALAPQALVQAAKIDEKPGLQSYKETLLDIVRRKYRFLLSRLQLSTSEIEELVRLLEQREQLRLKLQDAEAFTEELGISMGEIADLRYELDLLDEQIQALLGDQDIAKRFTLLKDSDKEQHEFSQYTLGINGLFPLDRKQQETVLLTRLEHKQKFDTTLEDVGLDMDYPLTYAQQQEMLAKIDYALFNYKKAYLDGVKPHLQHDESAMNQYALLENYTQTEFEQLKESLRQQVEDRGVIDPLPLSQN